MAAWRRCSAAAARPVPGAPRRRGDPAGGIRRPEGAHAAAGARRAPARPGPARRAGRGAVARPAAGRPGREPERAGEPGPAGARRPRRRSSPDRGLRAGCRARSTSPSSCGGAAARPARAGDRPRRPRCAASAAALALWGEPLAEDTYAEWARGPRGSAAARPRRCAGARPRRPRSRSGDRRGARGAGRRRRGGGRTAARVGRAGAGAGVGRGRVTGPAALARLAELRHRLADELGVDPSAEVERLQLRCCAASRPGRRPASRCPHRRRRPVGRSPSSPFVGRDGEFADGSRAAVRAGDGVVPARRASPGSGKSRLARRAVWRARSAHGAAGDRRPRLPRRTGRGVGPGALAAARGASRSTPAVADGAAGPRSARRSGRAAARAGRRPVTAVDGESRRALLLAGALRVLEAATGEGALLVVDDLQWADPEQRRRCSARCWPGCRGSPPCWRSAPTSCRRPRWPSCATSATAQWRSTLGPLPAPRCARSSSEPALAAAVLAGTDGTPFAIAEVLRELVARDAIVLGPTAADAPDRRRGRRRRRRRSRRPAAGRWQRRAGSPGRDRGRGAARCSRCSPGRYPARTVAAAAGIDGRAALDALSGLADRGAAAARRAGLGHRARSRRRDRGGGARRRPTAAGCTGCSRARWRPRRRSVRGRPAPPRRRATRSPPRQAYAAPRTARSPGTPPGRRRRSATPVSLWHPSRRSAPTCSRRAPRPARCTAIWPVPSPTCTPRCSDTGRPARSRRLARLAMLTFGAQDLRQAAELAELAVVEAGADDGRAGVRAGDRGHPGHEPGAARTGPRPRRNTALRLYRRHGDARGVARILDGRAMATFLDGRITEGVAVFGRVAQLFADSGDLLRVVTPRSTRGHGLVFIGRPADGLASHDRRAAPRPRPRRARGAGVRALAPVRGAVRARPHRRGGDRRPARRS